jgi:hypothetical protein
MTSATSIRPTSKAHFWGLPLYEFASGPDSMNGKRYSEAKAILAIGDTALGVIAIGGVARGGIAIGGLAVGGLAIGFKAIGAVAHILHF